MSKRKSKSNKSTKDSKVKDKDTIEKSSEEKSIKASFPELNPIGTVIDGESEELEYEINSEGNIEVKEITGIPEVIESPHLRRGRSLQKSTEGSRAELNKNVSFPVIPDKGINRGDVHKFIRPPVHTADRISSGSIAIDVVLGGGWPLGAVHEIYSEESVGKTHLALQACKESISIGRHACFLDYEGSTNYELAESMRIPYFFYDGSPDTDWEEVKKEPCLILVRPNDLESGEAFMSFLWTEGFDIGIWVIDSLAAMVPNQLLNAPSGSVKNMGITANLFSEFFKKQSKYQDVKNSALLVCNQTRMDMAAAMKSRNWRFTPEKRTYSSNVLKFYAVLRIELKKAEVIKDVYLDPSTNEEIEVRIAHAIKFIPKKNKALQPRPCKYYLKYGKGIDNYQTIIDFGFAYEYIEGYGGGWFNFNEEKIKEICEYTSSKKPKKYQGRAKLEAFLREVNHNDKTKTNYDILFDYLVKDGVIK